MLRLLSYCLIMFTALTLATASQAQMLANPSINSGDDRFSVGGGLVLSSVDYKLKAKREVERTIMTADGGFGLSSQVDAFAQLGLIANAKWQNVDGGGRGMMMGAGVRGNLYQGRRVQFRMYALLNYLKEEYDGVDMEDTIGKVYDADIKANVTELQTGAIVSFKVSPKIDFYAGLDAVPMSSGRATVTENSYYRYNLRALAIEASSDMRREDMLSMRMGANVRFKRLVFHPEVVLLSETTFAGTVNYMF